MISRRAAVRAALLGAAAAPVVAGAGQGRTTGASETASASGSPRRAPLTGLERTDAERLLVVVTKQQPLDPTDYVPPDLRPWQDGPYELRAEVVDQLDRLVTAAAADGHGLRVISGYRSYDTQANTFQYWARSRGEAAAAASSARPGHSEHQTGLAVDLDATRGGCYLDPCFGDTPEGRWVAAHAHRFGFVLSYPRGMQERTGYTFEPWHLRYVGPRVARLMHDLDLPLLQDYLSVPLSSAAWGSRLGSRP